jgi:hypothetical protein
MMTILILETLSVCRASTKSLTSPAALLNQCHPLDVKKNSNINGISFQQLLETDSQGKLVMKLPDMDRNPCLVEPCLYVSSCKDLIQWPGEALELQKTNSTSNGDSDRKRLSRERKFWLVLIWSFLALMGLFVSIRCMSFRSTHPNYTLLSPSP